jgi:integrase
MVYAGLRADEARMIRWRDFEWSAGMLMVKLDAGGQVKRRRERIVPIQDELREFLEPYEGKPADPVCGLGPGNLGRAFEDYLHYRGIERAGRTPHSCRHSYAALMTATGVPIQLVGAWMGHSNFKTTMEYTKMAARYSFDKRVQSWERGEMVLATGWRSAWPRKSV